MKYLLKIGLFTLVVFGLILASEFSPTKIRDNFPPSYRCGSQQKQVALGIIMYAQKHGGQLPEKWSDLRDIVDDHILVCSVKQPLFS